MGPERRGAAPVAYVTKTADQRRAEMAWASPERRAEMTDEMIYRVPGKGNWLTTSREFLYVEKAEAIEAARASLAKEYARLNEHRAQIDAVELTF